MRHASFVIIEVQTFKNQDEYLSSTNNKVATKCYKTLVVII